MSIFTTITTRIKAAVSDKLPKGLFEQQSKRDNSRTWLDSMYGGEYNPDKYRYDDYNDMLKDPQIATGIDIIRKTLLSKKPVITPATDSDEDKEIAEFIEKNLKNLSINFRQTRQDFYSALIYGYAVSEKVYRYNETDNKVEWDRFKSIDIATIEDCFNYDEYGNVTEVIQSINDLGDNKIPADKCMIYTYNEMFGNKYGSSNLKELYNLWYMKKKLMKWWAIYLQKHESPTLVGKAGAGGDANSILDMLEGVREGRQNIVIGAEDDAMVLESAHRGEGFERAIQYVDMMIFRRMGIGSLIMGQMEASGSYSQSQTHLDVMKLILDGVHEDLAALYQDEIKYLTDLNWQVEEYPLFTFEPFTERDLVGLLNALKPYIDVMAINPDSDGLHELLEATVQKMSGLEIEFKEEVQPAANPLTQPQTPEQVEEARQETEPIAPQETVIQRVQRQFEQRGNSQ